MGLAPIPLKTQIVDDVDAMLQPVTVWSRMRSQRRINGIAGHAQ